MAWLARWAVAVAVAIVALTGCSTTEVAEAEIESMEGRFEVEHLYHDMTVITDAKEGCQYLFYGGGFIQLTDKYGNPLLAQGYSRSEVGMSDDDGE